MQFDFPLNIDVLECIEQTSARLKDILSLVDKKFILISGPTSSRVYAETLIDMAGVTPLSWMVIEECSVANVYRIERTLRRELPTCIVAIGGGRVADFSKRLAYIGNIPMVLVPTIIANDGLISPIAVLQDEGKSVSLPGKMPDDVIIDMSIVGQAPEKYFKSAAYDLISNLSATNDWQRASLAESARLHHLAFQFARMAAYKMLDCREWDIRAEAFQRSIVDGQILSGVAMGLAGSSRPCSGAEHMISHALDTMHLGMDVLHGEKVGVTSRFCLYLQEKKVVETEPFFNHFSVPRIFPGCAGLDRLAIAEVFRLSRTMRPGRRTALDYYSDAELADIYLSYLATNERKR